MADNGAGRRSLHIGRETHGRIFSAHKPERLSACGRSSLGPWMRVLLPVIVFQINYMIIRVKSQAHARVTLTAMYSRPGSGMRTVPECTPMSVMVMFQVSITSTLYFLSSSKKNSLLDGHAKP